MLILTIGLSSLIYLQILDKLLDRESQTHKPQTLSSFYSSKPAGGSLRSPSKHGPSSSSGTTLVASSSNSSSAVACEELDEHKPVQSVAGQSTNNCGKHRGISTRFPAIIIIIVFVMIVFVNCIVVGLNFFFLCVSLF